MPPLVASLRAPLLAVALLATSACHPERFTLRDLAGVTAGGLGESWIVVEETTGRSDSRRIDVENNRYIVYRCLPSGCTAISVLRGTEVHELDRGAPSPTTMPRAPKTSTSPANTPSPTTLPTPR